MIDTSTRPLFVPVGLGHLFASWSRPRELRLGWLRLPGIPFTLALLALALPAFVTSGPLEGDIWWVLKNGQTLVARGELGSSDLFTFAPHTAAAMNVQWLAQLTYYAAYAQLGLQGVAFLNMLVVTATFALVFDVARRRSRNLVAAALATLVSEMTAVGALHPRAQTLAFLLFAATAWLLACAPRRLATILGLAALEAVWANLHGSFFLALLLTGLLLAATAWAALRTAGLRGLLLAREPRFLGLALVCQAMASLATPYGAQLYAYVLRLTSHPTIRGYATEWMPTNLYQPAGFCFFVSLGVTVILLARRRRGISLGDILTLGVFGLLGLQAVRNVSWWGLASGPILAVALADSPLPGRVVSLGGRLASPRQNLLRAGLLALVLVSASPWLKTSNPLLPITWRAMVPLEYPTAATNYLVSHDLAPRVFADQAWGNYLDWQLWPRYQVMLDSSLETHPPEVWLDYIAINSGHVSWQQRLDAYGVDVLLLNRSTQHELIDLVAESPRWRLAYQDEQAVIYVPASLGVPSR